MFVCCCGCKCVLRTLSHRCIKVPTNRIAQCIRQTISIMDSKLLAIPSKSHLPYLSFKHLFADKQRRAKQNREMNLISCRPENCELKRVHLPVFSPSSFTAIFIFCHCNGTLGLSITSVSTLLLCPNKGWHKNRGIRKRYGQIFGAWTQQVTQLKIRSRQIYFAVLRAALIKKLICFICT